MAHLTPCYRCPLAKTCELKQKMQAGARGHGFTSVKFPCSIKANLFKPGDRVTVRVILHFPDGEDVDIEHGEINATVLGWKGRKIRLQADEPFDLLSGDPRRILTVWPDRPVKTHEPPRELCKCGFVTTPLGSCQDPFKHFACVFRDLGRDQREGW